MGMPIVMASVIVASGALGYKRSKDAFFHFEKALGYNKDAQLILKNSKEKLYEKIRETDEIIQKVCTFKNNILNNSMKEFIEQWSRIENVEYIIPNFIDKELVFTYGNFKNIREMKNMNNESLELYNVIHDEEILKLEHSITQCSEEIEKIKNKSGISYEILSDKGSQYVNMTNLNHKAANNLSETINRICHNLNKVRENCEESLEQLYKLDYEFIELVYKLKFAIEGEGQNWIGYEERTKGVALKTFQLAYNIGCTIKKPIIDEGILQ